MAVGIYSRPASLHKEQVTILEERINFWFQCIREITEGTGEIGPPTFRLRDQQSIAHPNFLAVVFKTQEISQQVLFHNFHLIGFFGSNNYQGQKSWNFLTDLAIGMLVICSVIHVLGSPLMSV